MVIIFQYMLMTVVTILTPTISYDRPFAKLLVYHSLANVHVGIGPGGVVVLHTGRTLYNIYIIYVMCFGCLAQSLCLESKF